MVNDSNPSCFCGSNRPFADCCQPLLLGARAAASAEDLMRSRYTAYVLADAGYLLRSWHVSTRPARLSFTETPQPQWLSLTILRREQGGVQDQQGVVEFIARYRVEDRTQQQHEISQFLREQDQWFYLRGDLVTSAKAGKVGRNAPCICGSGHKFKQCCGR